MSQDLRKSHVQVSIDGKGSQKEGNTKFLGESTKSGPYRPKTAWLPISAVMWKARMVELKGSTLRARSSIHQSLSVDCFFKDF
ncbi:hypothetical protein HPP92_025984 [Vanilla planifolia]|uniref:Uncharacterized protein n=1 Tax=Vanilla planifolia TaxID=51239 RepID=A0A835PI74_VANPL|nr:hypothetical protein HPP92_025984 [Vanilla planifolia]